MPVMTRPMFSVMWYMLVTESGSYSLSGTCAQAAAVKSLSQRRSAREPAWPSDVPRRHPR
eukprot:scaffold6627_cov108-Isochrysis_galbana.AAC.5